MTWVKGTLKTIFILFICILVLTFVGEYFYLVLGLLVLAVILRQADKAKKRNLFVVDLVTLANLVKESLKIT